MRQFMELEADDAPISVTLIKPAAIDTPYKEHARNYLDVKPELVIEVRSQSDRMNKLLAKVSEYLAAGVSVEWGECGATAFSRKR